jgi:hypothetical protein
VSISPELLVLTPFEPEGDMGESMETLVSTFRNVGIEHRCTKSLLLISNDDESVVRPVNPPSRRTHKIPRTRAKYPNDQLRHLPKLTFSPEDKRSDKPIEIFIQMNSPSETRDIRPNSNKVEYKYRKDMSFRSSSEQAKEGESECKEVENEKNNRCCSLSWVFHCMSL